MDKKGGRRYQHEIVDSTRELTNAVSTFKSAVFKGVMMGEPFDAHNMNQLMTQFNQYLRMWENYANEISDGLKDCRTEKTDVRTLDYDEVREFIYANYDYASVLQFADGVFNGVGDGKFQTSDDIVDFFEHTVNKAFNNMPANVGGIIDTMLMPEQSEGMIDNLGFNYFKSVKNNRNLFNNRNRTEVYNAINKTLQYLVDNIDDLKISTTYNGTRLLIASINKILEYAQITAVVYAARIYIIGAYCYPFIMVKGNGPAKVTNKATESDTVSVKHESVMEEAAPNYDEVRYHIMRDLDDGIYRSPGETRNLINTMSKWIDDIGANNLFENMSAKPDFNRPYISEQQLQGNKFCQPMFDNPIFARISTVRQNGFNIYATRAFMTGAMNELVEMLRNSIYDRNQAVSTFASDKDGILHIIRGVDVEKETIDEYKKLAVDLYTCAVTLLCGIQQLCDSVGQVTQDELKDPVSSLPNANTGSECMRLLSYMYRDISFAIIQKARYIEDRFNKLTVEQTKKIFDDLSIKIPGTIDNKVDLNDFMMVAVPDTTRVPLDLMDLYALPTFEEMQMFDEWLKNDPFFENDVYFSEAINISSIINALSALIDAIRNKFNAFIQNQRVKSAMKWVKDHEKELPNLNFDGKTMEVLPFRKSSQTGNEDINIGIVTDNVKSGIRQCLSALDNADKIDEKFIDSILLAVYGETEIYDFFKNSNKYPNNSGSKFYRNYILFAPNLSSVKGNDPDLIKIQGNQISTYMIQWVNTVNSGMNALEQLNRVHKEIRQMMNTIRTKTSFITNDLNKKIKENNEQQKKDDDKPNTNTNHDSPNPSNRSSSTSSQTGTTPPTTAPNSSGSSGTNQNQKDNSSMQDEISSINNLLIELEKAIKNTWGISTDLMIEYIRTEYGYIQEAYKIANRQGQQ